MFRERKTKLLSLTFCKSKTIQRGSVKAYPESVQPVIKSFREESGRTGEEGELRQGFRISVWDGEKERMFLTYKLSKITIFSG